MAAGVRACATHHKQQQQCRVTRNATQRQKNSGSIDEQLIASVRKAGTQADELRRSPEITSAPDLPISRPPCRRRNRVRRGSRKMIRHQAKTLHTNVMPGQFRQAASRPMRKKKAQNRRERTQGEGGSHWSGRGWPCCTAP
jgi:hypothetical protein